MSRKILANLGAVLFCAALGALVVPGCQIRLEPGSGGPAQPDEGTQPDPTGAGFGGDAGAGGGGGGDTGLTPAELDQLQHVDPQQFALRAAVAAYAASATSALVESQVSDPQTIDAATLAALAEQYAPAAIEQATQWFSSGGQSEIPASEGVVVKFECESDPYTCPRKVECGTGAETLRCYVSQCGTGKCPYCPFGGNLVFKAWCAYGCMRNNQVVGGAFMLRTIFNNFNGPWCIDL